MRNTLSLLLLLLVSTAALCQNKKISEMTSATTLVGTESVPILQSGVNKKAPISLWSDLYQTKLVSGISLKTINSNSLLGSGNVSVGDALVSNPLSQFAATSSLQLLNLISDETGTGNLVFSTSPIFTTPRLASTSTTGYAWIATDNLGNASFQAFNALTDGDKGDITVSSSGTIWTIDSDAVSFAKIQNISSSRFAGRITGGSGDIEELTGTQATTLLDVFTSGLKGLVPASGGGTTNFLRADGTFAAPSSSLTIGTTTITSGTSTRVLFDDAGVVGEDDGFEYDKTVNGLEVGGIRTQTSGVYLKTIVVEISDWDMTAGDINVVHSLGDFKKIRGLQVIIRNDDDTLYYPLFIYNGVSFTGGGIAGVNSTHVQLVVETGGAFDNTSFNSTGYNRGWITIVYEQ